MIGDDVEIFVTHTRGSKARLGIKAPKDVPVHRKEIYNAIQRKKKDE
jgi:carbon storage regulator